MSCLGPPHPLRWNPSLRGIQESGLPLWSSRNPGISSLPSAPSWTILLHQLFLQEGRPAQPRLSSRAFCLLGLQEIAGAVAQGSSAPGAWGRGSGFTRLNPGELTAGVGRVDPPGILISRQKSEWGTCGLDWTSLSPRGSSDVFGGVPRTGGWTDTQVTSQVDPGGSIRGEKPRILNVSNSSYTPRMPGIASGGEAAGRSHQTTLRMN